MLRRMLAVTRLRAAIGRFWRAGERSGDAGEREARRHLERAGYRTMFRNRRVAGVEVDLLMLAPDEHTIVLVEVKSRAHADVGAALPRQAQRRRLRRAAEAIGRQWPGSPVRADVVLVLRERGRVRIEHRRGELRTVSATLWPDPEDR